MAVNAEPNAAYEGLIKVNSNHGKIETREGNGTIFSHFKSLLIP